MPAWIWPIKRADQNGWNVRLGRVFHWALLGAAGIVVAIALFVPAASIYNNWASARAQTAFDRKHARDGKWEITRPDKPKLIVYADRKLTDKQVGKVAEDHLASSPWDDYSDDSDAPITIYQGGDRPEITDLNFSPLLGLGIAASLALIGRTLRYLLAGE